MKLNEWYMSIIEIILPGVQHYYFEEIIYMIYFLIELIWLLTSLSLIESGFVF